MHPGEVGANGIQPLRSLQCDGNVAVVQKPVLSPVDFVGEAREYEISGDADGYGTEALDDEQPPPWIEARGSLGQVFGHAVGDEAAESARDCCKGVERSYEEEVRRMGIICG